MSNIMALEIKNISKCFPGVKALNDVSFNLKYGEIHALVGENGAGKSTLMNIIMGIHKPDSGKIILDDRVVSIHSPADAIKLGIGIVPQELSLVPEISVAENIFLGIERKHRLNISIDWKRMYQDATTLLESLGLKVDVKRKLGEFTVAYSQLVQIARTLAFGAKIIIMDEPTACLTMQECDILFDILKKLREQGNAIIFISHHMDEIKKVSDRITVMRDGSVVGTKNSEETDIQEIIKMMAGKEVMFERKIKETKYEEIILKVENLTRASEFENVSFDVKKGEIFGIAGLVGSGRTEIALTIFGENKKDCGSIFYQDVEINVKSPYQAIKLGIGYLPEERRQLGIFPVMTVAENMVMSVLKSISSVLGINKKKQIDLVNHYIASLKIKTPSPNKVIMNLSGGNQQKVILARWLARNIDLLILDEPTRGIDVGAKAEIHDLIRKITNNGKSVIMISSEIEELICVADRIMVMHEGEVKGFVNSNETNPEAILSMALN